jgi:hypothetical protein
MEMALSLQLDAVRLAGRTISHTNHICAFFNSPEEQYKVLMPFFKDGYDQGEKLFHVVDSGLHDNHRCACQSGGIDVRDAEERSQLEINDWEHTYLKDGYFDGDRMIRTVEEMLDASRAQFRVCA